MVNRPASPVKGEGSIKIFNLKTNNLMKKETSKKVLKQYKTTNSPLAKPAQKKKVDT